MLIVDLSLSLQILLVLNECPSDMGMHRRIGQVVVVVGGVIMMVIVMIMVMAIVVVVWMAVIGGGSETMVLCSCCSHSSGRSCRCPVQVRFHRLLLV